MVGPEVGAEMTLLVTEGCEEQWEHVVVLISTVWTVPFALPH